MDSSGNIYIAGKRHKPSLGGEFQRHRDSGDRTGVAGYSGDNGPASSAQLNSPTGVAVDSSGNIYIADDGNMRIREVSSGTITTVAGNNTYGYNGDGITRNHRLPVFSARGCRGFQRQPLHRRLRQYANPQGFRRHCYHGRRKWSSRL